MTTPGLDTIPPLELEEVTEESSPALRYRGAEVLRLTIDLGQGRTAEVAVHEADDPAEVAADFCRKQGLGEKLRRALERNIEANLEQLTQERKIERKDKSANNEVDNYGELLYYRGLRMRENSQLQIQREMQRRAHEESKELTFRPSISRSVGRLHRNPEDILLQQSKASKEALERKRQEAEQQETLECTFVPHINPKSASLVPRQTGDNFTRLYQDAKLRAVRKERLTKEVYEQHRRQVTCPFRPELPHSAHSAQHPYQRLLLAQGKSTRILEE